MTERSRIGGPLTLEALEALGSPPGWKTLRGVTDEELAQLRAGELPP
jgi:hypothetical protein